MVSKFFDKPKNQYAQNRNIVMIASFLRRNDKFDRWKESKCLVMSQSVVRRELTSVYCRVDDIHLLKEETKSDDGSD